MAEGIREGMRVRLKVDAERYPHAIVAAGAIGTVTEIDTASETWDQSFWVRLDESREGLAEWDNELHIWSGYGDVSYVDDSESAVDRWAEYVEVIS